MFNYKYSCFLKFFVILIICLSFFQDFFILFILNNIVNKYIVSQIFIINIMKFSGEIFICIQAIKVKKLN